MFLEFPVITEKEFPHGFRCTACKRVLEDGQPYQELPMSISGQTECVLLVCVYCTSEDVNWKDVAESWQTVI